jgi:hypothetical protein
LERTVGHALPCPTYRLADEATVVRVPPEGLPTASTRTRAWAGWEADTRHWLERQGDVSSGLATDICRFFVRAFEHTRHPQNAWFGVHKDRISLVVGGIFLAAVLRTSHDRGFWLLLADEPPPIEGLKHHAVKSAKHLQSLIFWGQVQRGRAGRSLPGSRASLDLTKETRERINAETRRRSATQRRAWIPRLLQPHQQWGSHEKHYHPDCSFCLCVSAPPR